MLTARERVEDRMRRLREGADDYLINRSPSSNWLPPARPLTRRGGNHSHSQMRIADLSIDLLSRKVFAAHSPGADCKEYALLCVLAQRSSLRSIEAAIAELVWDINFDTDTNVVGGGDQAPARQTRRSVREQAAAYHRGMGYVLENRALAESG